MQRDPVDHELLVELEADDDERELEAEDSRCTIERECCDFCDRPIPDYALFHGKSANYTICAACASEALHTLLDPSDPEVIAEAQDKEIALGDPPFGCSAYRDRMKLLKAGLRVFRVDAHTCTIKEFKWGKTSLNEGIDPSSEQGSWQKFEHFPTKAAVKRRIQELDQDARIVFESRL
jgi:hypothetical protein